MKEYNLLIKKLNNNNVSGLQIREISATNLFSSCNIKYKNKIIFEIRSANDYIAIQINNICIYIDDIRIDELSKTIKFYRKREIIGSCDLNFDNY
jgi:hypothetical protein